MSTLLLHSQITLPADDADVMRWSAACSEVKRWANIVDALPRSKPGKLRWAETNLRSAELKRNHAAALILKKQELLARRELLASAGMTLADLSLYRARRKDGEVWLVKIFQRSAAEFPTRDAALTFADFAPLLIAQGTCPVCLEKHPDLRAHIGTAACAAKTEVRSQMSEVRCQQPEGRAFA